MTKRLKKLIKRFVFTENNRSKLTFSDYARLNPSIHRLELIVTPPYGYSLDPDQKVHTWITNPDSVKGWLGFDAVYSNALDYELNPLTEVNFRLGDGTNEYYWNGSAWTINTTLWNTENEISANIPTFPYTGKKIQVIINLRTHNPEVTPRVEEIRILYASDIEYQEDLIIKSLLPMLRENIRPIGVYPVSLLTETEFINLNADYPLETPYNIVSIDSVYDEGADPDHFVDLLQSYNPTTTIITMTQTLPAGTVVWINFLWEPECGIKTDREYIELDRQPALYFTNINFLNPVRVGVRTEVRNKATLQAVVIPGLWQMDIEITMRGITTSLRDQTRLADEIRRFFAKFDLITSKATDDPYTMRIVQNYDNRPTTDEDGLHTGILRFRIINALFFQEQDEDAFVTGRFLLGGDMDTIIGLEGD